MMENGVYLAVSDVLSCTQYPGRHNTPLDSKKKKKSCTFLTTEGLHHHHK
jgi:hypothetical protein